MAIFLSTSREHPAYRQVTVVDGVAYLFRFSWNGRRERWTVSIYESESESPILLGLTIVDNWPLGRRSRDPRLPAGVFMALDVSGSGVDPGFADLHADGRSPLFFVPESELPTTEETVETVIAEQPP
jgi:hypothetical protein